MRRRSGCRALSSSQGPTDGHVGALFKSSSGRQALCARKRGLLSRFQAARILRARHHLCEKDRRTMDRSPAQIAEAQRLAREWKAKPEKQP